MKKILVLMALALVSLSPFAVSARDTYVQGYHRKDGTYVEGHYRSAPDNTVTNNYSYQGNTNPHTGQTGTNRYEHDVTSPYYQGADSDGRIGHSKRDDSFGLGQ